MLTCRTSQVSLFILAVYFSPANTAGLFLALNTQQSGAELSDSSSLPTLSVCSAWPFTFSAHPQSSWHRVCLWVTVAHSVLQRVTLNCGFGAELHFCCVLVSHMPTVITAGKETSTLGENVAQLYEITGICKVKSYTYRVDVHIYHLVLYYIMVCIVEC